MTLHTEKGAKSKWCPFARAVKGDHPGPANRWEESFPDNMCIASECMAWRWAVDEMRERHPKTKGDEIEVEEYRYRAGYCGLAGSAG